MRAMNRVLFALVAIALVGTAYAQTPPPPPPSPPPPSPLPSPPPSFPPFAPLLAGQSIVATNSTVVSLGLTFAGDLSNYPTPQIASLKNATDGCENHYERCVNHGVRVKKRHAAAQDRHGVQVKIRRGVPGGCV